MASPVERDCLEYPGRAPVCDLVLTARALRPHGLFR